VIGPTAPDRHLVLDLWTIVRRRTARRSRPPLVSPLTQITPANVKTLKVAWTFRTGDLPGKNDPVETTFEVTPIKVRDTVYLCSRHQRLFAVDAKTGALRWSYDPKVEDNPTFQHLICRGVSYHETAPGDTNADGAPAPTDCPRTIFLPVNGGRMIAVNADTGKLCESFANHGTLDLLVGMGVKTLGFYEPISPPVVSGKILVVSGAVIDNYSAQEPSGVIRGFDIHTGKLIWAWDAGQPTKTPCRPSSIRIRTTAWCIRARQS
jgi:quinoprotein glucose dehydrogenase